ncbi:MAG: formylglycine-generating enzyme family protein [Planctomycetota bacterium]
MSAPKACCTPSASSNPGSSPAYTGPLQAVLEPIRHADQGSTDGMIELPGGPFLMGTDYPKGFPDDGEGPVREVTLRPFWIDATSVTNAQFAAFVKDTGYTTEAERFGWSFVFHLHLSKKFAESLRKDATVPQTPWWLAVPGAKWDRPHGERSSIKAIMDHPAVHVSWNDAMEYARWAGKRLPTEAEWEYASRGGKEQTIFPWGDVLEPRGQHRCNVWQGKFPTNNTADDGYVGTCPATAFSPNGFGLHNTSGNVWEWVSDWFSPTWHVEASPETRDNPIGPMPVEQATSCCDSSNQKSSISNQQSVDSTGYRLTHKVQKGGSYLCHDSYCNRYRLGARTGNTPDSATTNNGFRCVRDV